LRIGNVCGVHQKMTNWPCALHPFYRMHRHLKYDISPSFPSQNSPFPPGFPLTKSGNAKFRNLSHLALRLPTDLVRHSPPQLHRVHLESLVPSMEDVDLLRYATCLIGVESPTCLGFELELVALIERVSILSLAMEFFF
jgi:hypothetical protein